MAVFDYDRAMTAEECKMFIRNYDELVFFFGEERVLQNAMKFRIGDFTSWEYVVRDSWMDRHFAQKGYPVLYEKTSWEFEEWRGEWMRKVRKPAREYLVPDSYQRHEERLVHLCLEDMYPQFMAFDYQIYHCDERDHKSEVYIKCENGKMLYCPLLALKEKNWDMVEKRHVSYMKSYYGNTPERAAKYLPEELAVLDTRTALKVKEMLSHE
jgi:hypothetical protein